MKKIKTFFKENFKDILWDITIIIIFILLVFVRLPYVIYKPGGIINVSDRITIKEDIKPNSGSYNLSYVTAVKANIPNLIASFFIKDWERIKIDDVTYSGTNYAETLQIEKYQLRNAIDNAIIIAYQKAGKNIEITGKKLMVISIEEQADTTLKLLDEIKEVDGISLNNGDELRAYLNTKNAGDTVKFKIIRNDTETEATAKLYQSEDKIVVGIYAFEDNKYTADPKIEVSTKESEAGASGGFMTCLAIYDSLIDEDLTHGKTIVGTGTIEADGSIGEIGGVKYKLLGAEKEHADIFFVPKDNYKEAKKIYDEYKLSFKLIKVEKIDDAIEYLNSII